MAFNIDRALENLSLDHSNDTTKSSSQRTPASNADHGIDGDSVRRLDDTTETPTGGTHITGLSNVHVSERVSGHRFAHTSDVRIDTHSGSSIEYPVLPGGSNISGNRTLPILNDISVTIENGLREGQQQIVAIRYESFGMPMPSDQQREQKAIVEEIRREQAEHRRKIEESLRQRDQRKLDEEERLALANYAVDARLVREQIAINGVLRGMRIRQMERELAAAAQWVAEQEAAGEFFFEDELPW